MSDVTSKAPTIRTFTKFQTLKNLLVLSSSFLLIISSSDALQMLQSTMNRDHGIGVASIAIQFALGIVTALLLMKYFIASYGSKYVIMYCILAHIPSIAANFYPHWETMIPSYILLGLASALLWGSNSVYLTLLAEIYVFKCQEDNNQISILEHFDKQPICGNTFKNQQYDSYLPSKTSVELTTYRHMSVTENKTAYDNIFATELKISTNADSLLKNSSSDINSSVSKLKKNEDNAVSDFRFIKNTVNETDRNCNFEIYTKSPASASEFESTTAIFFGIHAMSTQSGHIWSNLISFYMLQQGVTDEIFIRNSSCMCGANFCNIETNCFANNLKEPNTNIKCILISIFLAINILTVFLVGFFLDALEEKKNSSSFSIDFALATLKQLKKLDQVLLVPLSMYMGMSQGFFYADFSKAYIGCAWGMYHVGLVTVCYGVFCSIMSTFSGCMIKYLGRKTIFLVAGAVNFILQIMFLIWQPDSNQPYLFFLLSGMYGFFMGCFWSQIKAFHGVLFNSNAEAAFSCYELSHCLGACMAFAYSNYLCIYVKLYILLIVSTLGVIGYLIVEKHHAAVTK